jgi:hypothetical protein
VKLPVLVRCEPYNCKLSEESCANRWERARQTKPSAAAGNKAIANASLRGRLALCVDCEVGRERAGK